MIYSKYDKSQISEDILITTLTPCGTLGRHYNLYKMDTNDKMLVVFSDQSELLQAVNNNIGSVFGVQLLKSSNNKYCYKISSLEGDYLAYTVASAMVLIPACDKHGWRVAKLKNGGVTVKPTKEV